MRLILLRPIIGSLSLFLFLISCQKAWVPTAQLAPETDLPLTPAVPANAQMETIILPYRQQMAQQMNEVLGTSAQELRKVGTGESALGNFVADVQMAQALPLYKKPIDMSLITTGSLRATLPQGPITLSHVFELSPFENQLVVVTLPGTVVQKLFAQAAHNQELVIKNATFAIKDNKPQQILIDGQPLVPEKKYTIVMPDYLANGGDNLFFLKEATQVEPVGILARDALIKHIKQLTARQKLIEAQLDGRIKILP